MNKFKKILSKLKNGYIIDEFDIQYLKIYLGYKKSFFLSFLYIIIFISIFSFLLLLFINRNITIIICFILNILLSVFLFIFVLPLFDFSKHKKYNIALNTFILKRINQNNYYNVALVKYIKNNNFNIDKDTVFIVYDEYYYTIYENFIRKEKINIKNKVKEFLSPDITSVKKKEIKFRLQDISEYEIINYKPKQMYYNGYYYVDKNDTFFYIILKNNKTITLSTGIYTDIYSILKDNNF